MADIAREDGRERPKAREDGRERPKGLTYAEAGVDIDAGNGTPVGGETTAVPEREGATAARRGSVMPAEP